MQGREEEPRRRRDVRVHDDGSVSYVVDGDDGVEWHITIGPPIGDYEPALPEQRDWLKRRRDRT